MFLLFLLLSLTTLFFLRLLYILPSTHPTLSPPRSSPDRPKHLMILLGSGGHTAEMLLLLRTLRHPALYRRSYIYTHGDELSAAKGAAFETSLAGCGAERAAHCIYSIPRARRVKQSWLSTPFDSVKCFLGCISLFWKTGIPDVMVTNGPGSAVLLIGVLLGLRFLGIAHTRMVYVESFARVTRLSLTGKLLYHVVDRFVVQWEGLKKRYRRAEYRGVLVL